MEGYPVTIRLLDPPLHEFLPKREELMVEIARLELTGGDGVMLKRNAGCWRALKNCTSSIPCWASRVPIRDHHAGNYSHAGAGHHGGRLRARPRKGRRSFRRS